MDNLFEAVAYGDVEAVTHILKARDLKDAAALFEYTSLGETPLHHAAEVGNAEILKLLLEHGGKELFLNSFDDLSYTPLMRAMRGNHILIIKLLLEYGADIDSHEEARIGNTALAEAVRLQNIEIVKLLLAYGANPNIPGWMQLTAYDRAQQICEEAPQNEKAKLILEALMKRK